MNPDPKVIAKAAQILRQGGLIAFPTETVYGLGCSIAIREGIERIFSVKQRPASDPLIVHVSDPDQAKDWTINLPPLFFRLIDRFSPGPLTLVVRRSLKVPDIVTAGRETVALRIPDHRVALALIRETGTPIVAPSANLFSRPSPTTAEHVIADLFGKIDGIIDGGPTREGVESTVLDITTDPPVLLRPGAIPREVLEAAIEKEISLASEIGQDEREGKRSPGRFRRHYAPSVAVTVSQGSPEALAEKTLTVLGGLEHGRSVGVLLPQGWDLSRVRLSDAVDRIVIYQWGRWGDWAGLAHRLFDGLRWLEKQGVSHIVAPLPPETGLGLTVRDRLLKASARGPSAENEWYWGP